MVEEATKHSDITFEERVIVMLALMPHIKPQALDTIFLQNGALDRQFTQFGGWKGLSHGGFLPTGETAVFIIAGDDPIKSCEVVTRHVGLVVQKLMADLYIHKRHAPN